MLAENLKEVERKICEACKRANRKREDVTLIAVSKTKPVSMLNEVYQEGIRCFGENKVQELTDKYDQLPEDTRWHLIGHLQRNKVKYIVDKVELIHSVDSFRLAETIEQEAMKKNVIANILIEVNVAKETSKQGIFELDDVMETIHKISLLNNVHIKGLMTIAPICENSEENAIYFKQLKDLSVDIKQKNIDNVSMDILSMGMSSDYETAIKEGATYVRVGTSIFGERNYNIQ